MEEFAVPTVTFIIPHEVISVVHMVIDEEPVVLPVVSVIVEAEILVCTDAPFWLELLRTE